MSSADSGWFKRGGVVGDAMKAGAARAGFTMIEVVVAIMILSVGVLAMGASTGYVSARSRALDLQVERTTAVQQAAETLRAAEWTALEETCSAARLGTRRYPVACAVSQPAGDLKRVELVSSGPGVRRGRVVPDLADTLTIRFPRSLTR